MLNTRESKILKSLIQEYVATAMPVASKSLAQRYRLGISPATIRQEMARLEEKGYVIQPHTSAGRIPSEKGYRYYVEILMEESELSPEEQTLIRHQFYQIAREMEEWFRLTTAVLSRMLRTAAFITYPRLSQPQFKYLELISLRDFLVLLILLFREAKLKQQVVEVDEVLSQDELTAISRRFNEMFAGLTASEIRAKRLELSPVEESIKKVVLDLMEAEKSEYEELQLEGLWHILEQPEFSRREQALEIAEIMDERSRFKSLISRIPLSEGPRAIIGSENPEEAMRNCALVLGSYGLPYRASGAIGVVGPLRLPYEHAFSAVRFLSGIMSELITQLYG